MFPSDSGMMCSTDIEVSEGSLQKMQRMGASGDGRREHGSAPARRSGVNEAEAAQIKGSGSPLESPPSKGFGRHRGSCSLAARAKS